MKVLIVFGSKSDSPVYSEITSGLDESGIDYELRALSAHRAPEELHERLAKDDFDVVVAGAGLAAHLPGVAASQTVKPVIGVPCSGAFDGLDAFLSIVQMPPGIPVLCSPVDDGQEVARLLGLASKGLKKINIVGSKDGKAFLKAAETLERLDIDFETEKSTRPGAVNIVFASIEESPEPDDNFVIYCPLLAESTAEDAIPFMSAVASGLWVGVNRGENAALAAAALLGKFEPVREYRAQQRKKVVDADAELQGKNK